MAGTTILIRQVTLERLMQLGIKGKTYDDLINELIYFRERTQDSLNQRFGSRSRTSQGVRKAVGHKKIESEVNKNICEAVGCFAKATTTTEVKVGQKGLISLSLCEDCIKKFGDD